MERLNIEKLTRAELNALMLEKGIQEVEVAEEEKTEHDEI